MVPTIPAPQPPAGTSVLAFASLRLNLALWHTAELGRNLPSLQAKVDALREHLAAIEAQMKSALETVDEALAREDA